jgi:methionyl-tRNA formyltransferase
LSEKLRVVFFGTAEFAVPSLEALVSAGHEVLAVVTQPDKPKGRGLHPVPSPVKQAALRLGLPIMQPRRVRSESFIETMRQLAPDVLALAAFGQIIPEALLLLPPLGPINVHGSLLPKYRGAAPIQRAIMAGESVTGVTTMWMEPTLDTGDILLAEACPIDPEDTTGTLTKKLADIGARLLVATLEGLKQGTIVRQKQNEAEASYAPPIKPEDAIIRWHESAQAIVNRIRAMNPAPGAVAAIQSKRVKLWRAVPSGQQFEAPEGTIVAFQKSPPGVVVAAGGGTSLALLEVQPESGRRMDAAAWARGVRLKPGDRFEPLQPITG